MGFTGKMNSVFKMNYVDEILQSFGAKTFGSPLRKIERVLRFLNYEEQQAVHTLANLSKKRSHDQMEHDEPIAHRTRSHTVQQPSSKRCKVEQPIEEPIAQRTRSHAKPAVNIPPVTKTKAPAPPVASRTRSNKDAIAYRTRSHY